jgi:HK97 family phage prohead protease
MKTRDFATEWKTKGDQGLFEGYASIFNNVDDGFDVVLEGAFKEFARTKDGKTLVLHQHRSSDVIGKADVNQDAKGLYVKGQLVLEDPLAQRVYTHMKAGTLDGMSIGYDVLPGGASFTEAGVRRLEALKLWEVSVVTFGMNELAKIETVKAAGNIVSIREFEDFLRDAGGFSNRQARAIAEGGFKALQSARDEPNADAGAIATLLEQRLFKLG